MISVKKIWRQFRIIGRIDDFEWEISAELDFHIEMRTLDNIEAGMLPEAAREDALKRFGDVQQVQDDCQRVLRGSLSDRLAKNANRYVFVLGACGFLLAQAAHMLFPARDLLNLGHIGYLLFAIALLAKALLAVKERKALSQQSASKAKKNVLFDDGDQ